MAQTDRADHAVAVLDRLTTHGTLGSRVRTGMAWTGSTRLVLQAIQLCSTVALARLLSPSAYGQLAIIASISGFVSMFTELGISGAVVEARRVTDRFLATALTLNAATGVALTALMSALAFPIASFYDDASLTPLLIVASIGFSISVGSVQVGLLQRALQFKVLSVIDFQCTLFGVALTVCLAVLGIGAMSLVLGPLSTELLRALLLWRAVGWVPSARPSTADLRRIWSFGGGLLGFNFLNYWARNADNMILGKVVTVQALGYYGRSYAIMMLPLQQVTNVLTRVTFPALAELRDDLPRFRQTWMKTVRYSLVCGMPVSVGVTVASPAFVHVVFGDQWTGMSTMLSVMAASLPPQLIGRNVGTIFQAMGRTGVHFRLMAVVLVVTLLATVSGLTFGATGVACALLVTSWITLPISLLPAFRLIRMSSGAFLRGVVRIGACGLVSAACAVTPRLLLASAVEPPTLLVAQLVLLGVGYLLALHFLERELSRDVVSHCFALGARIGRSATRSRRVT